MDRHLFPSKDGDFNKFFFDLVLYLFGVNVPDPVTPAAGPNAIRLVIAAGYLDDLWQLFNQWAEIYPKATNELLTNHPLVEAKDNLRILVEAKIREIYGDIPESKLTLEDRIATNLKARDKQPTKVARAEYAPDIHIDSVLHLEHKLLITDPTHKGSRAIVNGQHIDLFIGVGAPDLPESEIQFTKTEFLTDAFHTQKFELADKGKTAYFQACYENASHEKGPKSLVVSSIII